MKFEIHYELGNDHTDYVIIEGETVQEIRERADYEVSRRNGKNPYSIKLED